MKQTFRARVLWKTLSFWVVFLALHFVYDVFPVFPVNLIGAIHESNFQHYKAGFFSYLIVNLVEYAWNYRMISDRESFLFSRLAATIFLPWIVFLLWYIAPALIGRWQSYAAEVIYANVITLLVGGYTVILESGLESIQYQKSLKFVLVSLFLISILLYIVFTYNLPWADVFVPPDY